MGGCFSAHKDSDSNMKFQLFGSKTDKIMILSPINGDRPIAEGGLKSQPVASVRDVGGKEETFFDSQPWLESDCEDDFFSVNGDVTPSSGSTPVNQSFSARTLRVNLTLSDDKQPCSKPETSPTNKKKLSDLLCESLKGDQDVDDQNTPANQNRVNGKVEAKTTIHGLPPKPADCTAFVSGANSVCSSEKTPNGDYRPDKEKPLKSVKCCLPIMLSSRSFSERKKKMSSAHSVG
ncbi:hypothetical protein CEY00_Acc30539 [Actinidia chinensis var. chinensis]|uniref:Uncharacterized protein n=1 Tax=Actinidia chinensis var. chinensis TaxID=1590841 RepID=A0A2R6P956_ACTCC|nr:hypothetical protein CEY00_Acc30539 [Actinidia chinensis var. chinensis]